MPQRPTVIAQTIKASHSILTGYGHWLPNDIRGSGSIEVRKDALKELGEIHHGRKRIQPSRQDLRAFHRAAEPRLDHSVLWFDADARALIAEAVRDVSQKRGYTLWAFSVMQNHLHAVVRTHREPVTTIMQVWEDATRRALREAGHAPANHPVWSQRPYKVFLSTREDVISRIQYVHDNPEKSKLPRQQWDFVVHCNLR